ncbi:nucleoside-diphosphate sugar epimerase [Candidatus Pacearchaeota archaeon]|nr:nucleoside-diphosphate sugar epimerase [Candidatus Pacearchaeota archaeon]
MGKKILITGSEGVIGSKLTKLLSDKSHSVFGIDLAHSNNVYGHGLGKVENDNFFRCDVGNYRQISDIIEYVKPDLIYHCAAEFGRWNGENFYEQVWKTNAIGTKHIIRLQEKHGFKLVHASSSEVYGDYKDVMYEEVLTKQPIDQLNDYAMSKRVNEMQIKNSKILHNTETVIVRFFNTYGPGEWYHPFRSVNCLFSYGLLHGRPITVFKGHTRTSTFIDDAVKTFGNIADNFKAGEIYNIANEYTHSIEDLVDIILKYTGADRQLVNYDENLEALTTKDKVVNCDKAKQDLNHECTVSLDEGVARTIDWMREFYTPEEDPGANQPEDEYPKVNWY